MTRILLVDDQRSLRRSLALMLQNAGFETSEAASGEEALLMLPKIAFDLVVTDLRMEEMSGIDLLREVKAVNPDLPVILITAYGCIQSAVDAMRFGAFDYLTKPFQELELLEKIRASQAMRHAVRAQAQPVPEQVGSDIVAATPQMQATLIRVGRVARTDISVLITGETGTGKTRIARLIHESSARNAHPFVSINCASLPEQLLESELFGHVRGSFTGAAESRTGLFEEADKGTIFLDEIDTLSPSMQAKLLSVLQERLIRRVGSNKTKLVDIRIVSATNQELNELMEKGGFRADLYFRLNGIRLHLPPLRERNEDIKILLDRFIAQYSKKYGRACLRLTPQALACVLGCPFPGNIRQIENLVEQMVVFADENGIIDIDALPEDILNDPARHRAPAIIAQQYEGGGIDAAEKNLIAATLARFPHFADAARELGIGRTTLWRKIRQYNLNRD